MDKRVYTFQQLEPTSYFAGARQRSTLPADISHHLSLHNGSCLHVFAAEAGFLFGRTVAVA